MVRTPLLALALLLLVGCGKCNTDENTVGDVPWTVLDEAALERPQLLQRQKAFQARDALAGQLMRRLQAAMQDGGPGAAIDVCRIAAPAVAAEISETQGVRIGRTSFRIRNPRNVPPAWAEPYVEKRAADNVFLSGPDGEMAALLPISLQQACLGCHGDPASLADPVKEALATHYPSDEATGFERGDLRGWFWLEIPKLEQP